MSFTILPKDFLNFVVKIENCVFEFENLIFLLGELEAIAMTEHIMERISYELERDPVEVRLNNVAAEYADVREVVQTLLADSEYDKRKEEVKEFNKLNRWKKRGLRVAFLSWPTPLLIDFHVLMTVYHGDGTVAVAHGGVEIGQGINTKVVQVIAYTLNISVDKVKVKPTTVEKNPNTFTTGTSRTTQSACFGAIKCCQILLDRLSAVREQLNNPTWELLVATAYNRGINLQTSYHVTSNDQTTYRSAGAAVTEVELDVLTGEHDVLRVDIIEDVGTSVNPEIDIGQVNIDLGLQIVNIRCLYTRFDYVSLRIDECECVHQYESR